MPAHDLRKLEYPRHLHKPSVPGEWVYVVVKDPEDCARRLAEGWSLTPILLDPAAPAAVQAPAAPASAPEAARWTVEVPAEALEADQAPQEPASAPVEPRRRRGRPRTGQTE